MDATDTPEVYLFDDFGLDSGGRGLFRRDDTGSRVPVTLGWRALDLLLLLVEHHGDLVSREKIMDAVWPGTVVEENNLTVQISALRRVLDHGRGEGSCIQTVPGRGYRFVADVKKFDRATSTQVRDPFRTDQGSGVAPALPNPGIINAPRLSLVVLPFNNLGGNHNDDDLAGAITEDLTTDLSRLPGAFVIARHSAATYKGQSIDIRRVGEELGVRYAVEGSVRRLGDVLRVNVQLISTETNTHLWAGRFDQNIEDPAAGQEEIVSRLRAALSLQVINAESARGMRERPDQPDAFDLLLRAWATWCNPPGPDALAQAATLFEQALRLDPTLVPAMRGLASVLIDQYMIAGGPDWGNENVLERAAELLSAAAAIDPENDGLLFCQGYLLRAQARPAESIAVLQRVIELAPNDFAAYRQFGFCRITQGRAEEAFPLLERAIRLDPLSLSNRFVYMWTGYALLMLGRDQEALPWLQRALAGGAMSRAHWRSRCYLFMASAHALMGNMDDARRTLAEANRIWPFATLRGMGPAITGPRGLPDPALRMQFRRVQQGLQLAGLRDHADEDADFGVAPDHALHGDLIGQTPMTVPGAKTIRTDQLTELLERQSPTLIDAALESWGWSIPGAIGLQGSGHGVPFSATLEKRFRSAMRELTGGNFSAPIVTFCNNSERFTGYNLTLRLAALGYTEVHWYRGGREAWAVNNHPEAELAVQGW